MSEFRYHIVTNAQEASGTIDAENREDAETQLRDMYGTLPKGVKGKAPKIKTLEVSE